MMRTFSIRQISALLGIFCIGLFTASIYFEVVQHLEPCPLCIIQRLLIGILAIFFLVSCLNTHRLWQLIFAGVCSLGGLLGIAVSARHVWLQHLPAGQIPACGPNLGYMLKYMPVSQTLKMIFTGSGECSEIHWHLLGLTMPEWTLICFNLITLLALTNLIRSFRASP